MSSIIRADTENRRTHVAFCDIFIGIIFRFPQPPFPRLPFYWLAYMTSIVLLAGVCHRPSSPVTLPAGGWAGRRARGRSGTVGQFCYVPGDTLFILPLFPLLHFQSSLMTCFALFKSIHGKVSCIRVILQKRKSHHSQECKDPRRQCFCVS